MTCFLSLRGEVVVEARAQLLAGFAGVRLDVADGAAHVAGGDRGGDRLVLVPDGLALPRRLQRGAHHPAQTDPVRLGAGADQRIAGGRVDGVMKGDVGVDHRLDVAAACGAPTVLDELRIEHGAALGGAPCGQRVERGPYLVDLGDLGAVERRDHHAASRRVLHEAVVLQQAQRLQHRLA